MAKVNYQKKLSVKGMDCLPEKLREQPAGTRTAIAHIIGRATGFDVVPTTFGDSYALNGAFKGVALNTGEVYRSSRCFLPDIASDEIIARLNTLENEGDAVEFAIELSVVREIRLNAKGEETGIGYAYGMSPLVEPDTASDPLAAIEAKIKALPAPEIVEAADEGPTDTEETTPKQTKRGK